MREFRYVRLNIITRTRAKLKKNGVLLRTFAQNLIFADTTTTTVAAILQRARNSG